MAERLLGGVDAALGISSLALFLPDADGAFAMFRCVGCTSGTTGVRLTNASDCAGQDCVIPVGYSYWSNINNHVGSDTMLIVAGLMLAWEHV